MHPQNHTGMQFMQARGSQAVSSKKQQVGDLITRIEALNHGEVIKSIKEDGGDHLDFSLTGVLLGVL